MDFELAWMQEERSTVGDGPATASSANREQRNRLHASPCGLPLPQRVRCSVRQLRHLAFIDPVTGLVNRQCLQLLVAQQLQQYPQQALNLLYLDLDKFKAINDTFGHHVGDEVLKQFGQAIVHAFREEDLCVRLGGDEFIVVLPKLSRPALERKVRALLAQLQHPFQTGNLRLELTASIGVVEYPAHGQSLEQLLQHADDAMYHAKRHGANKFIWFEPSMALSRQQRAQLQQDLQQDTVFEQLSLVYQPIVDAWQQPLAIEVLVRWQHPQFGLLEAKDWLDLAFRNGLLPRIEWWVLEHAMRQARSWSKTEQPLRLSVNIHQRQLRDLGFSQKLKQLSQQVDWPLSALQLECGGGSFEVVDQPLRESLGALKRLGVRLVLQDMDEASLALVRWPSALVDGIKPKRLDEGLSLHYEADRRLLSFYAQCCKQLSLELVVEGIESHWQWRWLRRHGVERFQGFWFGKPMSCSLLRLWLHQAKKKPQTGLRQELSHQAGRP